MPESMPADLKITAMDDKGCVMAEAHQKYDVRGVQFHPEFTSTPRAGHPLFLAFIKAALERHNAVTPIAA